MKSKAVFSLLIVALFCQLSLAQSVGHSDCKNAFVICELGNYHFKNLKGSGEDLNELSTTQCIQGNEKESNSIWISWTVKAKGLMVFTITPDNMANDVDFVLFKKESGKGCEGMEDIRCMASGKNLGSESSDGRCLGDTGLNHRSLDKIEMRGCKYNDDNYLKYLEGNAGEEYVLLINNYHSEEGVSVYFDGTVLLKQEPNCDQIKAKNNFEVLEVFPNPSDDMLMIHLSSATHQTIQLELLDMTGKLQKEKSWRMQSGQQVQDLTVNDIPKGSYLLRIKSTDRTIVRKIIVQ